MSYIYYYICIIVIDMLSKRENPRNCSRVPSSKAEGPDQFKTPETTETQQYYLV